MASVIATKPHDRQAFRQTFVQTLHPAYESGNDLPKRQEKAHAPLQRHALD